MGPCNGCEWTVNVLVEVGLLERHLWIEAQKEVRHVHRRRVQILQKQRENGLLDLDAEATALDDGIQVFRNLLIGCEKVEVAEVS
jgi:hypothetical protein